MFRSGKYYENLKNIKEYPFLGKIDAFKIISNVYFIGTYQASSHLIDTGDGLIMIDTGYSNTAYLVVKSIYDLGFKPEQIKYIINTHWHGDHTEATALFKDLSGAKTIIGRDDFEKAKQHFTADILVDDGDTITLGNTTVEFIHTPGHTLGTISLFFNVTENGKVYRVGMFGGAGTNTLVKERYDFDGCLDAYGKSLERLKKEKVDVFIGNHTWNNDTFGKKELSEKTGNNAFIDDKIWLQFLDCYKERLNKILKDV